MRTRLRLWHFRCRVELGFRGTLLPPHLWLNLTVNEVPMLSRLPVRYRTLHLPTVGMLTTRTHTRSDGWRSWCRMAWIRRTMME